ncbi:MAG: ABC transporter permease subunit [Cytophagales bacterium]|nr:ABC transporter permease subunit [Armatimonadota bacterium]
MNTGNSTLLRALFQDNPMALEGTRVWRRFLRTGGETGRAVNVVVIGLFSILYLWLLGTILHYGEDWSGGLLYLEAILLTLAVPASMYAAVSGERERLTWDSLLMTRLSPGQIVIGKLLWRVAFIGGILLLFLPLLLLCHFMPGHARPDSTGYVVRDADYTLAQMGYAQALLFSWALALASFCLWVSTKTKRSITTLAVATVSLLSFLVLVPMLTALFGGKCELLARDHDYSTSYSYQARLESGYAPLAVLSTGLIHLNPFYQLYSLSYEDDLFSTSSLKQDAWRIWGLNDVMPLIYFGASGLFLLGAWRTLQTLEAPRRTLG